MLLPYASDVPPSRRPAATLALVAINIVVTAVVLLGAMDGRWRELTVLNQVGIVPGRFRLHMLLTYQFFHESPGHLALNMFYLWVFGVGVEAAVGSGRFLLLYVLSGVVGGGLQYLVTTTLLNAIPMTAPIVGASAACAGLIGLYAVRYYRARLSFVLLPFRLHVVTVVSMFLAYEIGSGLWDLAHGSLAGGAAHWAHIGGFVFGLSCAQALRLTEAGQRAYLTQDAAQAMDRSVPGAAIKRWETLLSREPNNTLACTELARAWLMLGDKEQATSQYRVAIETLLLQNHRPEAARLYLEMHEHGLKARQLSPEQMYILGSELEEMEQFTPAAEALREVAIRSPDAPEAEAALLKVISLYIHRLQRYEEARILLSLFQERYPQSPWRALAQDLAEKAGNRD